MIVSEVYKSDFLLHGFRLRVVVVPKLCKTLFYEAVNIACSIVTVSNKWNTSNVHFLQDSHTLCDLYLGIILIFLQTHS